VIDGAHSTLKDGSTSASHLSIDTVCSSVAGDWKGIIRSLEDAGP
jgi:hypothetical protein